MFGAIAGDVIGSAFEANPTKREDFPLFPEGSTFTDDTVLTVAVADAILNNGDYGHYLKLYGKEYPSAGYGMSFYLWIFANDSRPYNSWGNGSAMRASPVGFAFDSVERVLSEAKYSARVTHDHPEGIKGAQATALAILMARTGRGKAEIRNEIARRFSYDLYRTVEEIRPGYSFDVSCQGSVPQALIAFFDSENYEDAVRKAVSLGGDSDTQACIAGGVAQAFYRKIPEHIVEEVRKRLPDEFLDVIDKFNDSFGIS